MSDLLNALFSSHLPVLPVLLPLFTAVALLIMGDDGGEASHGGPLLQRRRLLSLVFVALGAVLACAS